MVNEHLGVFDTKRLNIRIATSEDVSLIFDLWTNPHVMANVGFPQGLPITRQEIVDKLREEMTPFGQRLVIELKNSGQAIGECKLGVPNDAGIAETDVKLLPTHWGHRFGVNVKRGLVTYLFEHTDCIIVQATPNIADVASIKMQKAVGGKRVGEGAFEFSEAMRH